MSQVSLTFIFGMESDNSPKTTLCDSDRHVLFCYDSLKAKKDSNYFSRWQIPHI